MIRVYSDEQVRARLTEYVAQHGRATTCARGDFNASYLSQVLTGKTPPSPKVLELLGLQRAIVDRTGRAGRVK